jgi:hypothetical protein
VDTPKGGWTGTFRETTRKAKKGKSPAFSIQTLTSPNELHQLGLLFKRTLSISGVLFHLWRIVDGL